MGLSGKSARRDEALWQEFLDEFYDGGKRLVTNTNRDTKDRYPKVEVLTLLKTDPKFRKLVKGQFQRWLPQRQKRGPSGTPVESLDQLEKGSRLSWAEGDQTVRGVVEKARANRAIVRDESGQVRHIRPWDLESGNVRLIASLRRLAQTDARFRSALVGQMVKMAESVPPRWDDFLQWRFGSQGGRTVVRNTNHETRKRFPEVEVDTLVKNDDNFHKRLLDDYQRWMQASDGRNEDEVAPGRHGFRVSEFDKPEQLASDLKQLQKKYGSLADNKYIRQLRAHLADDKAVPMRLFYQAEHALRGAELGSERGGEKVGAVRRRLHSTREAAEHALRYERPSVAIDAPDQLAKSLSKAAKRVRAVQEAVKAAQAGHPLSGEQIDSAIKGIEEWGARASDEDVYDATDGALMLLNAQAEGYIKADENGRPTDGIGQPRLPKKSAEQGLPQHVRVPSGWDADSDIVRYADAHVPMYAEKFKDFFAGLDHRFQTEAEEYEEDVLDKYPDPETRKAVQAMWAERPDAEKKLYVGAQEVGRKFFHDVLSMRERAALGQALEDWQDHPSSPRAHRLYGLLEGLGVSGGKRARDKGAKAQQHRSEGPKDEDLRRAIAKAMAFSKAYFDHLGLQDVSLYRGMRAPGDAQQGDDLKVSGLRELSSLSMSPVTAYTFSIPKTVPKRAVKYRVPVERLFLSPVTVPSLGSAPPWSENEFVAAGLEDLPGKVMPQYISDYDPETMKIAREHKTWTTDLSEEDDSEWHRHMAKTRKKGPQLDFQQEKTAAQIHGLAKQNPVFRDAIRRQLRKMAGSLPIS